jgi:type IV pilus modification protein PilV
MFLREKKHEESKERQQGFTLLEIIIALFIFAIGIMGVTMMQTMALSNTNAARQRVGASSWLTSQMEQIISTPYASLSSGTALQGNYSMSWTVDPAVNNSRTVHLTVTWLEGSANRSTTFDIIRVMGI